MRILRYNLGPLDNNTYVLVDDASGDAAIVDPSFDSRAIWSEIQQSGWHLRYVLNTHAHIDHVVENAFFAHRAGAPVALHPADRPLLDAIAMQAAWLGTAPPEVVQPAISLAHGMEIALGSATLHVAHTPGHSPGHVSFLGEDFAIVGDVLFRGSVGRTDLPGGDADALAASIERELLVLPDNTYIYPGHGPLTTIGEERRDNPYVGGSVRYRLED